MSLQNISAAFETRLAAMSPNLATAYENQPFTPVTGTPYQRARVLPAEPENPTLGDDYFREVGFFEVTLFYPINQGRGAAQARAVAVQQFFKRGTFMTQGGDVVKVTRTPTISPAVQEGDRYIVAITIFYRVEQF